MKTQPVAQRTAGVIKTCVVWQGAIDVDGYGRLSVGNKWKQAHRIEWERAYGPIPSHLQVDHICRNRACININHLELVTRKENILRGLGPTAINARRKVCVHGHTLEGDNLRIRWDGHRECIPCSRRRVNDYGKRRRAISKAEKGA